MIINKYTAIGQGIKHEYTENGDIPTMFNDKTDFTLTDDNGNMTRYYCQFIRAEFYPKRKAQKETWHFYFRIVHSEFLGKGE